MLSEKKNLILIFAVLFVLSTSLIYLMIKKDLQEQENSKARLRDNFQMKEENIWPKVEIETRK